MPNKPLQPREIFVFDSAVLDVQRLIDALGPEEKIVILDEGTDGVLQLARALADESGLDAIHIISHGAAGTLKLGSTLLNQATISKYEAALKQVGAALAESGDLLLYGCNVAKGEEGRDFVERLGVATGADVAASDDLTGSPEVEGGDWKLEEKLGQIDAIEAEFSKEYPWTLAAGSLIDASSNYDLSVAASAAFLANLAYASMPDDITPFPAAIRQKLVAMGWQPLHDPINNLDAAGGHFAIGYTGQDDRNAYAFAAKHEISATSVQYAISFRGSDSIFSSEISSDWIDNNLSRYGWSEYYKAVRPVLESLLLQAALDKEAGKDVQLILTGHSLGGASAQAAILDLFVPEGLGVWTDPDAALNAGDRIWSSARLSGHKTTLQSLLVSTVAYTYGSPSILIDPVKPSIFESALLLAFGSSALIAIGTVASLVPNPMKFGWGNGPAFNALMRSHVFQFEHKGGGVSDPVSNIGASDLGTVLNIDLNNVVLSGTGTIMGRYGDLVNSVTDDGPPIGFELHAMAGYLESVLRLISNQPLSLDKTSLDSPYPTLSAAGTGRNDFIVGNTSVNINAGAGNDVLILTSSTTSVDGGAGSDSYVIKAEAAPRLTVRGPAGEQEDTIVVLGDCIITQSYPDDVDGILLKFSEDGWEREVLIQGAIGPAGSVYRVNEILVVQTNAASNWDLKSIAISDPLINAGTSLNDLICGTAAGDTMTGEAGHDTMYGRGGSDAIHGQGGNDVLRGGVGADTLYGGANNDDLQGDEGADLLYGQDGSDTLFAESTGDTLSGGAGDDIYKVNAPAGSTVYIREWDNVAASGLDTLEITAVGADPLKTRFSVVGTELIVEVRNTSNQVLSTVRIQNDGNLATVETLRINYSGPLSQTYQLQQQMDFANAGVTLGIPSDPAVPDYADNITTSGRLTINSSVSSAIDSPGDTDWYQVILIAGRSYRFDMKGAPTGSGTLPDPFIRLRDAAGTKLVWDDDTGTGNDASLGYTATATGTYYISAGSSVLAQHGSYLLSAVQTSVTPPAANTAPMIAGGSQVLTAGSTLAANALFKAIDGEGNAIVSYTITNASGSGYFQIGGVRQPEGGSFMVTAGQFVGLQYVVGAAGTTDTFVVRASDGSLEGPNHSISVASTAPAPTNPVSYKAQDDVYTTTSGSSIVLPVLANDDSNLVQITDLHGEDARYVTIQHGSQNTITVSPPSHFVGDFRFSYTAIDGKGSVAYANVVVNVTAPLQVNQIPVAPDLHQTISTGQQTIVDLLLFSSDPDADDAGQLAIQGYSTPGHGALTRTGNLLTYLPDSGFVGDDTFTYVIGDPHGAQATGVVKVTVAQALAAFDDTAATGVGATVTFNVLQNDKYASNSLFFLQGPDFLGTSPAHGTVSLSQSGLATYTPDAGYSGVDTFTYRATYLGTGAYSTGNVTIMVGNTGQQGGAGPDILNGTDASNALFGNGGDDVVWGGAGNDVLDGGEGFDTISFVGAPAGISVNLELPYADGTGAINWADPYFWTHDGLGGRDSVRNMEAVLGSEFSDLIEGNPAANSLFGSGGNDSISGGGGNDTAYGGEGDDLLQSGVNLGVAGKYDFIGGGGNDYLVGNTGVDSLDGGPGNDSIDGWGGIDNLVGREGNDRLRGTGTLDGGDGDDVLGVSNVLSGSVVASRLVGGNGNDQLSGNSGNDTLEGGSDNDTLGGGIGDDFMDGGTGFDLVDLRGEPAGVNVDLATGFAQTTRGIKTLVSIEAIYGSWNASDRILGSDAPEGLYGDFGDDTLIGSGGSDSLDGGTGNDWIQGGDGADSLTGGAGTDRFVYSSMADRGDVISDFVAGQGGDVIDIASVVAGSGYSGATPAAAGYLRLVVAGSDTQVQFDLDGSLGNFVFETLATLRGVLPSTLTSANFSAGVDASTLLDGIPVTFQIGFSGAGQKPGSEDAAVAEGDTGSTSIVLQIVRSGNTASSVTAALTFETGHGLDHSDFIDGLPADRTLVFAPGQTTYSIALSVVGDALLEADEKLSVTVSSPTVPDPTSANFWILSNENLIEGDGSVLGTDLDDVIQTRGAADFVLAGTGNDIISTGAGADYVDAGDGDDVIDAGEGRDTIDGGAGDDSLVGGDGADVFKFAASGNGVDTISGFSGGDQIIVGARLAALPAVAAGGVVNGTRVHVGSSGGSTSMFIDADGIAGADIEIQLVGAHPYYAFEITDNDDGTTGIALATAQNLTGDSGGNALTGRALNDMISGMAGNDTLSGGLGDDTLDGGADNDTASYAGVTGGVTVLLWNNQATGADGADTLLSIENLIGTAFNDRLDGTNSANDLYGSDGADSLYGYAGADILAGGQGNDLIDGGADTDTASFATATGAVSVFLWSGQATGADGSDVLFNIDSVVGSAFGDRLDGTNIANRLEGVNGMDSLYGYGGNDTLIGGAGNDVLDGGADTDTASFAGASGAVTAYLWGSQAAGADGTDTLASIENLIGSAFNDRLDGTNSANSLEGGAGADSLYSYGGNDTLTGGAGNDLLDGGADTDTASYAGATGSVTVYLWGSQATGAGGTDTLGSIENLIGSGFNDRLDGTNTANSLDGGAGADSLYGYGGNDTLTGGAGNDVLDGGADTDTVSYAGATGSITAYLWNGQVTGDGTDTLVGIETLIGSGFNDRLDGTNTANSLDGGAGADSLYGYGGNDTLTGGIGNDVLDGGADTDTASYAGATGAVTAYLWNSQATGAGGTDTLTNIENLIGSAFNDRLDGTNSANSVEGGTGADSLYGYGGADTLTGGAGNDVLDGGADADAFMFDAGSGVDLVYNFAIAQGDKINLKSGLNGSGITSAAQALASTTDVGGHATVNLGSGHTITLVGVTTAGLSAADFVIF